MNCSDRPRQPVAGEVGLRRCRHAVVAVFSVLLWIVAIGYGFSTLWRFSYTPGPAAEAAGIWPSTLPRDASQPTLVVVLHPECACSQATLGELARIVTHAAVPLRVLVLFGDESDDRTLERGALWRSAKAIPGITAIVDRDGEQARRLGANVSGQTFLFDRDGHLIFSGGITAARGHAGDNDGAAAVLEALTNGHAPLSMTPVFGCLLRGSTAS